MSKSSAKSSAATSRQDEQKNIKSSASAIKNSTFFFMGLVYKIFPVWEYQNMLCVEKHIISKIFFGLNFLGKKPIAKMVYGWRSRPCAGCNLGFLNEVWYV